MGKVATSPLPYRGSPPLQSGGQSQKWPTSGQNGYLTPAVSGIPTASERGAKSEVAHKKVASRIGPQVGKVAKWPHPCRIGDPHRFRARGKIRSGPQEGKWLPHPCRIGDPHRRAGGKVRSGPQVGKVATSPLPYRRCPPLHSGGQNEKWPTSGQCGYLTPAVSGDSHRFRAGGKVRSGPQVGKVAASPLPYRGIPTASERGAKSEVAHKWAKWLPHPCRIGGSPPLQSGGQNRKWPTNGQSGYLTPAVSGIPTALERGAKSEVAHKWAKWLPHPCRIGDAHRFRAGGKMRSGPQVGKVAASPLPYRGSPALQSGGQNEKRPTSGQSGYLTPAVSGISTASKRGAKSEVAHKWAKWLPHPCRIGDPHRFRAGGKVRSGPQVGKMATSPLPYRGSPPLLSGGQNERWPTSGQSGCLTPAVSGIPTASKRGGKVRSGPQVGKVATSPLPYRRCPPLHSGGQNEKWPTSGQCGYLTPAVSGDSHRFRAGGKVRSGPQVGKVATSPPPYRGIPTASEREAK